MGADVEQSCVLPTELAQGSNNSAAYHTGGGTDQALQLLNAGRTTTLAVVRANLIRPKPAVIVQRQEVRAVVDAEETERASEKGVHQR